jgi:hypothetical protein
MTKMTAITSSSEFVLVGKYHPPPPKQGLFVLSDYSFLFSTLFSYKYNPLIPLLILGTVACGRLCSEYTRASYPSDPLFLPALMVYNGQIPYPVLDWVSVLVPDYGSVPVCDKQIVKRYFLPRLNAIKQAGREYTAQQNTEAVRNGGIRVAASLWRCRIVKMRRVKNLSVCVTGRR